MVEWRRVGGQAGRQAGRQTHGLPCLADTYYTRLQGQTLGWAGQLASSGGRKEAGGQELLLAASTAGGGQLAAS